MFNEIEANLERYLGKTGYRVDDADQSQMSEFDDSDFRRNRHSDGPEQDTDQDQDNSADQADSDGGGDGSSE